MTLSAHAFTKGKPLSVSQKDAHRALENYVKINSKVSPCDDFFQFVCGADRPKSSEDRQDEEFFHSFIKAVRADKKYLNISKSILSHMDELYQFQSNETHQFKCLNKFMKSFGFLPFLKGPLNNASQFLDSLVTLIFLPPEIFINDTLFSPIGIKADYSSNNNTLHLQATFSDGIFNQLSETDGKSDNFGDYFEQSAWNVYHNLWYLYEQFPAYDNISTTYDEAPNVTDFANEYFNITAKSGVNSMINKPLRKLTNKKLQKAIIKSLSSRVNNVVDMKNLNVTIDEQLFEDLLALFLSKPKEGQHFILSMALLTISYSVDLFSSPFTSDIGNFDLNDTTNWYFDHVLSPKKSGAIFNLYAADLVIRNKFPMTSVKEILSARSLVEKIQLSLKNTLFATSFLKNNRNLITVLNLLDSITINVGLPENVYDRENFTSELEQFPVFHTEDDLIDQIIKLRISNFRLRSRSLSSRKSHFSTVFDFDTDTNSLTLSFLPFQAPNYDESYVDSYNIGNLGTVIGHELFHRFSPPNEQESWVQEDKFNKSLECYKSFYHEKMCYELNLYNMETGAYKWNVCASDFKDPYAENIPDVEGTRIAYRVLKEKYGKNLKAEAMPNIFNFTHEQLFFVAFANKLCDSSKSNNDEHLSWALYNSDAHQPAKVRINAVALQMSEFATAFNCKANDSMVLPQQQRCHMLPVD